MRELHLSDLWAIGAGLLIFLVLLTWQAWWPLLYAIGWSIFQRYRQRPIMSPPPKSAPPTGGMDAVHVPVPHTGTEAHTTPQPTGGMGAGLPDIDAENDAWEPPRLSRRLSDQETLALLAVQRRPDGKYRHSANGIAALIGGSRNDVLAQVRAIRSGAPEVEPVYQELDEQHRSAGVAPPK